MSRRFRAAEFRTPIATARPRRTATPTPPPTATPTPSGGELWSWGDNDDGQLGDGTTDDRGAPVQVVGIAGITAVAAGGFHSLLLRDGAVWAWGQNNYGQLGDNSTDDQVVPFQVGGVAGFRPASARSPPASITAWRSGTTARSGPGA